MKDIFNDWNEWVHNGFTPLMDDSGTIYVESDSFEYAEFLISLNENYDDAVVFIKQKDSLFDPRVNFPAYLEALKSKVKTTYELIEILHKSIPEMENFWEFLTTVLLENDINVDEPSFLIKKLTGFHFQ